MITVEAFIQKCFIPLNEEWGYIYGTWGRIWTAQLQRIYSQPSKTNWKKTKQYGSKWIGRMVTDCSGLIRWACYQLGVKVSHHSNYLYTDYCRNKGKLKDGLRADGTQPLPGSLVFLTNHEGRKHHVGVYCGDNIVIEAKGTEWGVVTSELAHWDSWGQLKCVDYDNTSVPDNSQETDVKYAITINPHSYLNLRAQPNKKASVIAKIPKGTKVVILDKNNKDWWRIKYDGHIGYAASEYLNDI